MNDEERDEDIETPHLKRKKMRALKMMVIFWGNPKL